MNFQLVKMMKKLKDASPKDDKSSLYNLIDVLSK